MHRHHVIPKHEWKKRFGNLRGFNSQDNIVCLTVEQHAEAHKLLYELNGNEFDLYASQSLSGLITKEETRKLAALVVLKGNTHTKGKKLPIRTQEHRDNQSKALTGSKLSVETRGRISESISEWWRKKKENSYGNVALPQSKI